jgi:hypothetical protein
MQQFKHIKTDKPHQIHKAQSNTCHKQYFP